MQKKIIHFFLVGNIWLYRYIKWLFFTHTFFFFLFFDNFLLTIDLLLPNRNCFFLFFYIFFFFGFWIVFIHFIFIITGTTIHSQHTLYIFLFFFFSLKCNCNGFPPSLSLFLCARKKKLERNERILTWLLFCYQPYLSEPPAGNQYMPVFLFFFLFFWRLLTSDCPGPVPFKFGKDQSK